MPFYEDEKKPGTYFFKINYKEDGQYKQVLRRGFKSKKEVKAAMTELENSINKGTFIKPVSTPYADFIKDWLNDKKMNVKRGTLGTYTALSKHIVKGLGKLDLQKITPRDIQNFYNSLSESGKLSDENIQKCHTIINETMKKALSWDMIAKNPASLVDRPKARKKEMQVWTLKEAHQFLKFASSDPLHIVFLLALTTGMRQGEILGLRWKDVNFESRTIGVSQILSHDGKRFEAGAKTLSGSRPIKVDAATMAALAAYQTKAKEKRMRYANVFEDNGIVICTKFGKPVNPSSVLRTFERLVIQINEKLVADKVEGQEITLLKKIRFHDLRHSHVTYLIQNRETPQAIAERLGWADTRMIDNYAHILPHIQEDTADTFGKSFYIGS